MELKKYMSPLQAWAFALGTSIGWGSFFITSNMYLPSAGPLGSLIGLLIGALVMLFVAHNYHFMMNRFHSSGGAYSYVNEILGRDYGFLVSIFLGLTYIAMFWANATSLPLFAHYFLNSFLKVGVHYSLFGYEIYITEALLAVFAIILTGFLCTKFLRLPAFLMTVFALIFTAVILFCSGYALFGHKNTVFSFEPFFMPSGHELSQILKIAFISPWAFIGFENISHFLPEFNFSAKKTGFILRSAIITATLLYIALILLSVTAYPEEYGNWFAYIKDLQNLSGLKALPVFYAATFYLGDSGFYLLLLALFALIMTSLIGNIYALSRLLLALAKNNVISQKFGILSKNSIPVNSIWLIVAISIIVPFFGRVAIGWIVDVTTIGAAIVYGFLSFATYKLAKNEAKRIEIFTGFFSLVAMAIFFSFLIIPNFFSKGTLSSQAYFLFSLWAVIGFFRFHSLLKNDRERVYGKSNVVWIFLLALILLLTLVWMINTNRSAIENGILTLSEYIQGLSETGSNLETNSINFTIALHLAFKNVFDANLMTTLIVILLFLVTAFIIISNTNIIKKREIEHEHEIYKTRSIAFKDSLTNVKSKHAYVDYETKMNQEISEKIIGEFSVVVCDVNNLKWVNDNLGHKAGDEYIKEACHIICVIFDHSPVFRIGGDEFVIISKGYDYEHRAELMQKLNKVSEENKGKMGKVVIAAGISDFNSETDNSLVTVFERADANMYIRKKELKKQDFL